MDEAEKQADEDGKAKENDAHETPHTTATHTPAAPAASEDSNDEAETPKEEQTDRLLKELVLMAPGDPLKSVRYSCGGWDLQDNPCDNITELRNGEPIRCKFCGSRMLFKVRTDRLVQFEAR